ncbi:MAG TPA: hypothetical protein VES36_00240 [Candidatus Limnocylindrales bacterium]|nr:hypothetical protein [Candidatus Limnocylindrales bacterium]
MAGHAPAGLIGGDRATGADREHQRLVGRLTRGGQAADRLVQAAGGNGQPEQLKDLADLAHRDAELLVELRGDRDRARPQLRAGGPDRVAGLIGVASLRPLAAAPAAPTADPKVTHVPADLQDLLLVLIDLVLELKLSAAAARARIRQPDPDLLIDMTWDTPVRLGAVLLAALAPDLAGSFLGSPLENGAA